MLTLFPSLSFSVSHTLLPLFCSLLLLRSIRAIRTMVKKDGRQTDRQHKLTYHVHRGLWTLRNFLQTSFFPLHSTQKLLALFFSGGWIGKKEKVSLVHRVGWGGREYRVKRWNWEKREKKIEFFIHFAAPSFFFLFSPLESSRNTKFHHKVSFWSASNNKSLWNYYPFFPPLFLPLRRWVWSPFHLAFGEWSYT